MVAFLKSKDNRAWKTVVKWWTHPTITVEDDTTSLKAEVDWSEREDIKALDNSKALNAIFIGVDKKMSYTSNIFQYIISQTNKEVFLVRNIILKLIILIFLPL
jgi:hypothetical protein